MVEIDVYSTGYDEWRYDPVFHEWSWQRFVSFNDVVWC